MSIIAAGEAYQSFDGLHDFVRGVGVQPWCGLVQEKHARVADERDADVGSLGLATTDSAR